MTSTVTSSTSDTGKNGVGHGPKNGAEYGDKNGSVNNEINVAKCIVANDVFICHNDEDDDGFTRLANALYLKDMDQDGYLLCETAREVVESYSSVYNLEIKKKRLEDVLAQTSNGQHVDIQTLLRMLSQRKSC